MPDEKTADLNPQNQASRLKNLVEAVQAAKREPSDSSARYEAAAVALARFCQDISRADRHLSGDATVLPAEAFAALDLGIDPFLRGDRPAADLRAGLLRAATPLMHALGPPLTDPLAVFRTTDEITESAAAPILSAYGQRGALLPEGEVAVLTGAGGTGKSAMLADIALAVTTPQGAGAARHAGEIIQAHGDDAPVLWLAFEEPVTAIRDRLRGLDPDGQRGRQRIRIADMRALEDPRERRLYGPADDYPYRIEPQSGMALLGRALAAAGEADPGKRAPRLVIVDTLLRGFAGDPHKAGDVLTYLDGLGLLARRHRLGVLGVAHSTKAARTGKETPEDLLDPGAVSGHGQWLDAPRTTLCLSGHHDDQAGRYHRMTVTKTNVGPDAITIRIYREFAGGDGPIRRFTADGEYWQSVYADLHSGDTNGKRTRKRGYA